MSGNGGVPREGKTVLLRACWLERLRGARCGAVGGEGRGEEKNSISETARVYMVADCERYI